MIKEIQKSVMKRLTLVVKAGKRALRIRPFKYFLNFFSFFNLLLLVFLSPITLAKSSIWFPHGVDFSKIESIDDQSQAWATCAGLNQMLSVLNETIDPELSRQRLGLFEADKFIIMLTLLPRYGTDEEEMKPLIQTVDRLVTERAKNMFQISKENKEEVEKGLFNNSVAVCEQNSIFATELIKEFKSKSIVDGSTEQAFLKFYISQK